MTAIAQLPPSPLPSDDEATLNDKMFATFAALPDFIDQSNAQALENNAAAAAAALSQGQAAASEAAALLYKNAAAANAVNAAAAAGASAFVSGAAVTSGSDRRWSLINGRVYVAKTSGVRNVDPALDRANWGDLVEMPRIRVTGATALVAGNIYELDSTAGVFNLTMPAAFAATDRIGIVDVGLALDINPVTLLRNGNNIRRVAEDLICDQRGDSFFLVGQTTIGWIEE